jgi:hypothetical protein
MDMLVTKEKICPVLSFCCAASSYRQWTRQPAGLLAYRSLWLGMGSNADQQQQHNRWSTMALLVGSLQHSTGFGANL